MHQQEVRQPVCHDWCCRVCITRDAPCSHVSSRQSLVSAMRWGATVAQLYQICTSPALRSTHAAQNIFVRRATLMSTTWPKLPRLLILLCLQGRHSRLAWDVCTVHCCPVSLPAMFVASCLHHLLQKVLMALWSRCSPCSTYSIGLILLATYKCQSELSLEHKPMST